MCLCKKKVIRAKQKGLTLLEVMVALAVFAIMASAILKAVGENLSATGQIETITFANWVANNQLTQIKLENKWPIRNNERGSVNMANREWYWVREVKTANDDDLREVIVTVGLDPSYEGSITSVTAYFAKPTAQTTQAGE